MSSQRMMHYLPVEAYTSQDWFEMEQKKIFSRTWAFAGFKEDLTEPGQYKSIQAGLNNIFIIVGRDKRLRAFHNICRHRGTQLIRAVGKTQKALTCPYHDWTYDLDGKLLSVPDEDTEYAGKPIDKSCLSLMSASVDIWRSMIFVHPDPNAGSIMEWFGDVEPYLGPHKVEDLKEYPDANLTYEIKANWKIVVENYMDVYHLSHLHSGTLMMYDHAKAKYGFIGPHYAMWEPLIEEYEKNVERYAPGPLIIPKEKAGTWVPMLFPGLGLAEGESQWATFNITALAPNLTRVENRVRLANVSDWSFASQGMKSYSFWASKTKPKFTGHELQGKDDPMASGDFTQEDIYACEQQQKSMESPYFQVGPAAQGESPVTDHQKVVLEWMNKP